MGYQSSGAMVIEGPKDKMAGLLGAVALSGDKHAKELLGKDDNPVVTIQTRGDITRWELKFAGWKWYTSYLDIYCYEELWAQAQEAELNGFRWRQGEEPADMRIDEIGNSVEGAHALLGLCVNFGEGVDFYQAPAFVLIAGLAAYDVPTEAVGSEHYDQFYESTQRILKLYAGLPMKVTRARDEEGNFDYLKLELYGEGVTEQMCLQALGIYNQHLSDEKLELKYCAVGAGHIGEDGCTLHGTEDFDWRDAYDFGFQRAYSAGYTEWADVPETAEE